MAAVDNHHRIWRDGKFVDWEDATIHVMSHVVHYGSSVFEGIRCYETPNGPAVFRLGSHMRRFEDAGEIRRRFLLAFEDAEKSVDPSERDAFMTFVIVGGGATGSRPQ